MSKKRRNIAEPALEKRETKARRGGLRWWHWALAVLAAAFALFEVYGPALRGPFLFDDLYLPFTENGFARRSFTSTLVGVRPLLMLSFWINIKLWGVEPYSYHAFNVLFHLGAGILVFFIVRKVVQRAGVADWRRDTLSAFAAALFLLHPVQTESVAYVASRSETMSVLLCFGAFALFVQRLPEPVSWLRSAAILALFGLAVLTKEHTLALVPLLLLTDYYWHPGFSFQGLRRNWRLYAPMAAGAAFGGVWVARVLQASDTAGFGYKGFTWYEYALTQCRAVWTYLRMIVLPYGQNLDHDYPLSHTPLEHGAFLGLIAIAAVSAAAFFYRRRFPLASYGWFVYLILLAPTSSVVPIADPIAEHRIYLPFIGITLVAVDLLRRWRTTAPAMAATLAVVLVVAGALTYQRNKVWGSSLALWRDSVEKSPAKLRPRFQLAYALFELRRCDESVREYEKAAALGVPDLRLMIDWAMALDCANRPDEAIAKLQESFKYKQQPALIYSLIGLIESQRGRLKEALEALNTSIGMDASSSHAYHYRARVYLASRDYAAAAGDYRRAVELNPDDTLALQGLVQAENALKRTR